MCPREACGIILAREDATLSRGYFHALRARPPAREKLGTSLLVVSSPSRLLIFFNRIWAESQNYIVKLFLFRNSRADAYDVLKYCGIHLSNIFHVARVVSREIPLACSRRVGYWGRYRKLEGRPYHRDFGYGGTRPKTRGSPNHCWRHIWNDYWVEEGVLSKGSFSFLSPSPRDSFTGTQVPVFQSVNSCLEYFFAFTQTHSTLRVKWL